MSGARRTTAPKRAVPLPCLIPTPRRVQTIQTYERGERWGGSCGQERRKPRISNGATPSIGKCQVYTASQSSMHRGRLWMSWHRPASFPMRKSATRTKPYLNRWFGRWEYTIRLVKSPGLGYHHTFAVVYDATGGIQTRLPRTVAQALASAFRRLPNPHRVPRRKPSGTP